MAERLTKDDIAEACKVSRETINNWMRRGLPYEKVGRCVRFKVETVEQWLRDREIRETV